MKRHKQIKLNTETEKQLAEKRYELKIELEKTWLRYHNTPPKEITCTHDTEEDTLTCIDSQTGQAITTDINNKHNKTISTLIKELKRLETRVEDEKIPPYWY